MRPSKVTCPVCKKEEEPKTRRIERKFWMRLIPGSKRYYCTECGLVFITVMGGIKLASSSSGPLFHSL